MGDSGAYSLLAGDLTAVSHVDATGAGTAYGYAVSAYNALGEGPVCAAVQVSTLFIPFNGQYAALPYIKIAGSASCGPYRYSFDGAGNYTKAFGADPASESGTYVYDSLNRSLLLGFYSSGTLYNFTFAPVAFFGAGDFCAELYTYAPDAAGAAFPAGVFKRKLAFFSRQSGGGESDEEWRLTLTLASTGAYAMERNTVYSTGSSSTDSGYSGDNMWTSGKWTYNAATGAMTMTNYNDAYSRDTEIKTVSLDGTEYYYFSNALFQK